MITIACVLHTSPFYNRNDKVEYTPEHVRWVKRQVESFCSIPHRFVCFSNVDILGVEVIPLEENWPGWWSKLEMFKHLSQAFYLDLDTALVGNIDELVRLQLLPGFHALQSLTHAIEPRLNSGIMAWNGDFSRLYTAFKVNPQANIEKYVTHRRWGDQGFIQDHIAGFHAIQHKHRGQIISYKADMNQQGDPPAATRIVCFHGQPKPEHVKEKHAWIMA